MTRHPAVSAGRHLLSAGHRRNRSWRWDWQAGLVEDDRARRRERLPGHPVMVTAQQQVRRVVPAGYRRHDRDNKGLAGQQQARSAFLSARQ
jgi:hypothetical protein